MDLLYDKHALLEYLERMHRMTTILKSDQDESSTHLTSCKQRYFRLRGELEQASRKAYNRVENAESMQRSAELLRQTGLRILDSAESEQASASAKMQIRTASVQLAKANVELEAANEQYRSVQDTLRHVNELWEKYKPLLEAASRQMEDHFFTFHTLVQTQDQVLSRYMAVMQQVEDALQNRGDHVATGQHRDSFESKHEVSTLAQIKSHTSTVKGKLDTNNDDSTLLGNENLFGMFENQGKSTIVMVLNGQVYTFPNTKSGAAKAHRLALQSNNSEMIEKTQEAFKKGSVSPKAALPPNQQYIVETLLRLQADAPAVIDREMVLAGLEVRMQDVADDADLIKDLVDQNVTKTHLPQNGEWFTSSAKGNSDFIISDDAIIRWGRGDKDQCTGAELKQWMREKYGIDSVRYNHKEPDFSPFADSNIGQIYLDKMPTKRSGGSYSQAEKIAMSKLGLKSQTDVQEYMKRVGLTWHECSDGHSVIAIPTRINAAFKHTGGISIERSVESMRETISLQTDGALFSLQRESHEGKTEGLSQAIDAQHENFRETKTRLFGK